MVWNRPFKDRIQGPYDYWLANRRYECTAVRIMKPIPVRLAVEQIIKSWEEISI